MKQSNQAAVRVYTSSSIHFEVVHVEGVIPTTLNELAMNSCFALCMIIMTYNIIRGWL